MRAQALGVLIMLVLVCAPLWAGIIETDLPPPQRVVPGLDAGQGGRGTSRATRQPGTPQSGLDTYVETLRQRLQHATAAIPHTGLVEVKLSIRRDGALAFVDVVPLDGPAQLRAEVLQALQALGPWPPPPVNEDVLLITIPLALNDERRDGFGRLERP